MLEVEVLVKQVLNEDSEIECLEEMHDVAKALLSAMDEIGA